jgi:RNA polymerase sigma-54 factor
MFNNSQIQTLKQTLKINPQQIQFLNFLYLNSQELEQYISNELEENPFIQEDGKKVEEITQHEDFSADDTGGDNISLKELDWENSFSPEEYDYGIPQYKTADNNYDGDADEYRFEVSDESQTLVDEIRQNLIVIDMTEKEKQIADFLLNSVDDKGFLNSTIDQLTDDISFSTGKFYSEEEVAKVKGIINRLDPVGFASEDLKEYLLIQLQEKLRQGEDVGEAIKVLEQAFDKFVNREYADMQQMFGLKEEELKNIIIQISALSPSPAFGKDTSKGFSNNPTIIPDYVVTIENGKPSGQLNNPKNYFFSINENYAEELLKHPDSKTREYVNNKVKSALWFVDAIRQREETMTKVIKALVYLQGDFFVSGENNQLKPMVLKEVADLIGMDISTVSRVTSSKYAQTPFGLINLRTLFSEGIKTDDGEMISNKEVQDKVMKLVETENKSNPLTDLDIQQVLESEGITLTRRTITKYRLFLNIPSSKLRRTLS